MVFNSPVFIFLFLPGILLLHFTSPNRWKNLLLFASSIFFYAWGDFYSTPVLLFSILINYIFGLLTESAKFQRVRKTLLFLSLTLNLTLLFVYKYLNFALVSLASGGFVERNALDFSVSHLPLGISFFSFSAIAYQIEIYRGRAAAEWNFIDFGLYMAHFAKIVAGPIVRYQDMLPEIKMRGASLPGLAHGASRFVIGLAKKVLVANPVGLFADEVFKDAGNLDAPSAWLGILCYTIQIYFDFSGYSDMAIGLGRMMGFRFMENFNYPYISESIQEFWRRWHISLSTWFRDYLYIPLGGNRASSPRTYFNLLTVFLLCGLWHGANWSFVIWGAYHGMFLALERTGFGNALKKMWKPARHLYAMFVIMCGWVFFRAESITQALEYFEDMFTLSWSSFEYYRMNFLSNQLLLAIVIGFIGSSPIISWIRRLRCRVEALGSPFWLKFYDLNCSTAAVALFVILLIASAMQLAVTTFTPFIYTKF